MYLEIRAHSQIMPSGVRNKKIVSIDLWCYGSLLFFLSNLLPKWILTLFAFISISHFDTFLFNSALKWTFIDWVGNIFAWWKFCYLPLELRLLCFIEKNRGWFNLFGYISLFLLLNTVLFVIERKSCLKKGQCISIKFVVLCCVDDMKFPMFFMMDQNWKHAVCLHWLLSTENIFVGCSLVQSSGSIEILFVSEIDIESFFWWRNLMRKNKVPQACQNHLTLINFIIFFMISFYIKAHLTL